MVLNKYEFDIKKIAFLLLFITLFSTSCSKGGVIREAHFNKSSFTNLKGWKNDRHLAAFKAFLNSCDAIMKRKPGDPISGLTSVGGKSEDWQQICVTGLISEIESDQEAREFFEKWFAVYSITDEKGGDMGRMTGYYEIELNGSRKPTKKYKYPIYKTPPNIEKLKGCNGFCHASINRGALKNKNLEIVWVDSKARAFFLHIQGSGVVRLPGGQEVKLGYACQNGFPYTGIGSVFKKYGIDGVCTATQIMEWLDKNPKRGIRLMEENKSYVFFREVYGESPMGGQGVPLKGERSIAMDVKLYPYGAPFWLETNLPTTKYSRSTDPYNRLMVAQDTGGAIKGAIRADIFFGRGTKAEVLASSTSSIGRYYILLPKSIYVPTTQKAF